MTVNEMIERLKQLANKHGDYEVRTFQHGAVFNRPATSINVDDYWNKKYNRKLIIIKD